ncbi:MAG TPA: clostripain-related cysteine peptidase [Methanothrix sp.]|nr:clostripain-related cysteine peptidase [Methanothrix sp.]
MKHEAKWTFMVYMAGDNNLSDAGELDLQEMMKVGSNPDINVVVEFDNAGELGTNRYLIQKDSEIVPVESLGETDSGDPEVLNDFVSWAYDMYPAGRYALILWNHGGGWEPMEMDKIARSMQARSYNSREAGSLLASQMKKALFSTSVQKILSQSSSYERAICSDDGSGHSLDTIELGKVLSKTKDTLGKSLDILGMDACLMSNLEVAYQAAPYVNYIIASEEEEPNEGWPYESVLKILVDLPDIEIPDFSSQLVKGYIDYYKNVGQTGVTQSAFNLSKVKEASMTLDVLGGMLIDHMPDAATEIWKAQRKSVKFFRNTLWDINHFLKELSEVTSSNEVKDATKQAKAAFMAGPNKFVISESHFGSWFDYCCGASIYLMPPPGNISKYYGDLDFSKEIKNWPLMLQKYHESP